MRYLVMCNDPDINRVDAFGQDAYPQFDTRDEAESEMARLIYGWPKDAPVREEYCVIEVRGNE